MEPIWLVPFALGAIGSAIFLAAALVSRRFDRKHPHLSRKGMRVAEKRENASRAPVSRTQIPVPSFLPEEWRMDSVRDEAADERLAKSLTRWGDRVANDPKRSGRTRASSHR